MSCSLNKKLLGCLAVFGGFLIHLTLGNLYSFGNLMTYMDSYMHLRVDENVTVSNFIWVLAMTTASQGFFMVIGGEMQKKIGIRCTCLIGSLIMSSGIMLTYFTINSSFVAVIATYGFMNGLGTGLSYTAPLACGMKWFPKHKGFVTGIIVGGFGLGSLVSTFMQTRFLNPDNVPPEISGYFEDAKLLDRVPYVFLLMGILFLCLQIISCLLISNPTYEEPKEEGEFLLQEIEREEARPRRDFRIEQKDLSVMEAIRTRVFGVLWFTFFLQSITIGYINAMYKSFGQTFITNDFFLSQVGSFAAIFNFLGRLAWGRLMDLSSFRVSMTIMTLVQASLYATLPLTPTMGRESFAIWIWMIFFCFSCTFVLISTVTEKAFGTTSYASIYGLIFTNQAASAIVLPFINKALLRFGFSGCFYIVAGILLGSTCIIRLLPRKL